MLSAILCLTLLQAPAAPDLDYTLSVHPAADPALGPNFAGELRFRAAEEGPTHVALDEGWGGTQNIAAQLQFIEVTAEDGESLELTEVEPARWLVECDPGETLVAHWAFPANALQDDPDPSQHYKPIVGDSLVHIIGSLGLIGVPHLDEAQELAIRFQWTGLDELGWKAASSFGAGPGPHEVMTSQQDFLHSLFLAGSFDLELRDVGGQDLAVAVAPGGWGFSPEEFADLCSAVVETQREFMDDWDTPWYLVSLIPVGQPTNRGFSLGGTGLTNAFATFCQPGASLDPGGPQRTQIVMLLAHEMFHEWNGKIIRRAPDEEIPLYWFSEGFTEFFERRTALLAGLITAEDAVADVNEHLRSYATSPVRNAGNARIIEGFWSDPDVQQLPYMRGDLIACFLDHAIRERSAGKSSLDDLMRSLAGANGSEAVRGTELTTETLFAHFKEWAGEEATTTVRAWVLDGGPILLPEDTFGACGRLESTEETTFDLGFDGNVSRRSKRITGLRAGSPAAEAGLEEGAVVSGWSVRPGRPDVPVVLTVVGEDGAERTIRFLPAGPAVTCQRLVLTGDCSGL